MKKKDRVITCLKLKKKKSLVSISFDASVCWNVSLLNANVELKRMPQQETGRHFI